MDEAGTLVGVVSVIPELGWSDHVGQLRLLVDPAHRGQGIGRRPLRPGGLGAGARAWPIEDHRRGGRGPAARHQHVHRAWFRSRGPASLAYP